jgi:hypothetical protein
MYGYVRDVPTFTLTLQESVPSSHSIGDSELQRLSGRGNEQKNVSYRVIIRPDPLNRVTIMRKLLIFVNLLVHDDTLMTLQSATFVLSPFTKDAVMLLRTDTQLCIQSILRCKCHMCIKIQNSMCNRLDKEGKSTQNASP